MTLAQPILLYDGSCGFCAASVQFVLRHDRTGTLRFAPLDGPIGREIVRRHPEIASVDSAVWVEPAVAAAAETVLTRSAAALRVARYLGGVWRLAALARIVPRAWRDAAYGVVARHRHRLARGEPQCLEPTPEQQNRFVS